MQNTMVRGGDGQLGKKIKKGKEKRRKIRFKKGKKGLKNASFWAIYSKKIRGGGGLPTLLHHPLPQPYLSGKKLKLERGGGEMIRKHNIYPCL